jgi:hypothetical protein
LIRFYLNLVFPLLGLFMTAAVLIRVQPYDDHDLRALLMPDGCEMPCFMGIRPGLTPGDDAIRILHTSEWIGEIELYWNAYGGLDRVGWKWNGKQPPILSSVSENEIMLSFSNGVNFQYVDTIRVVTSLPTGYAYLLLGGVQTKALKTVDRRKAQVLAIYPQNYMNIWSIVSCPAKKDNFWDSLMTIDFMSASAQQDANNFSNPEISC